ncbi:MAG: class I SAM-dependent methyltransferase [Anaerolineae bacterium]|nr:class I SAM-dependent methyltransferase [Anaerolineae bacterium]
MYVYRDDLTDERSDAEVALWVTSLELDSPMKILDLACGFGRHANRLAALGHSITGVDFMPGFLELARQQATQMGLQVDYRQGDMRQLSFMEEFDRVVLLFTSFGYFDDDENVQVLESVARALKPGGLLGFDIPNRDVVVKDLPSCHVVDKDGDLMINRLSFDALTGRFHNRRIVIRDGIRKDKPFSIRLYNATEIRDLLKRVCLEIHKILGNGGQPLSADSSRMVVVARKPLRT